MGNYNLVRDEVPRLLEKWEKTPVDWKSAKEHKYLHKSLYVTKLKKEFEKLLISFDEKDNNDKIFEQMAEVVEILEAMSVNCFHTGFPRVLKIKEERAKQQGKYNNQILLWENE